MGREWLDSAPRPLRMVPVVLQVLSGMTKEVYAFIEIPFRGILIPNCREKRLQWGSEIWMCLHFKWCKQVGFSNGQVLEWNLESRLKSLDFKWQKSKMAALKHFPTICNLTLKKSGF